MRNFEKKSLILFSILMLAIIWSIWATYDRVMLRHDYLVSVEVHCDPETESCFVYEEDGEGPYFYKIVEKRAYNLPECDPADEECLDLITCHNDEPECSIIHCDVSVDQMCSEVPDTASNQEPELNYESDGLEISTLNVLRLLI